MSSSGITKSGDVNIEIKVSKIIFYLNIGISFFIFMLSLVFAGFNVVKFMALFAVGVGCLFRSFYIQSQRIYITNMDVRYQCWFQRKAIKTVESFNATGIWIFNSVVFTGRGYSRIKMSNVENFDKIRELVESVDHLRAKN